MYIFSVLAIILIAQLIAYKQNQKLADTLPVTCCGFILVLYLLAFFGGLSTVNYICIPIVLIMIIWLLYNAELGMFLRQLLTVQNVCLLSVMVLITFLMSDRTAIWWDDINYWATDAKQLWHLGGFAGKYGNVAPDFGDYPPAINLFKWFFLQMSPAKYKEGLGYAGYTCFNFILLLPLISRIDEVIVKKAAPSLPGDNVNVKVATNKKYYVSDRKLISKYKVRFTDRNITLEDRISPVTVIMTAVLNLVACLCLLLLPTFANKICFEGTCVDVTMGILYGILLWDIKNRDGKSQNYYCIRIGIYGAVLVLCKSIGLMWALGAALFMVICYRLRKKGQSFDSSLYEDDLKAIIISWSLWAVSIGSWMLFCLKNRRLAKSTGSVVSMLKTGDWKLGYWIKEKAAPFFKGFAIYPMHTDKSFLLDLSALVIIVIYVAVIIIITRKNMVSRNQGRMLMLFNVIGAVVSYGIVFAGHITVFATETQYSEGQVMAISISRYSAPYVIGMFILLCGIFIDSIEGIPDDHPVMEGVIKERMQSNNARRAAYVYGCIALFILVTCDYGAFWNGVYGYRNTLETDKNDINNMIDIADDFLTMIENNEELKGSRILYLRDMTEHGYVYNSYISYAASPVSVVYGDINSQMSLTQLQSTIADSHAAYLYIEDDADEDLTENEVSQFEEMASRLCKDQYLGTGLYRIYDDNKLELYRRTIEME